MREEVVWDLTLGKVVENFVFSPMNGQMVVCFDDGTFTAFEAIHDYDSDITIVPCELDWFEFGDEWLIEAGVIDKLEIELKRETRAAMWREACEDQERHTYERLKKKFEVDG